MQFKKVGRELLREAKRREGEWAVLAKAKGNNLFFQIACKMMSHRCVPGRDDSAKKTP